jgi:hypothetical protein
MLFTAFQGSALHSVIEGIFVTTSSRNRFTMSFLNLMLKQCQLQMRDISLQVEFPMLNNLFMCLSEIKEFNAESQYLAHGCLLRGLFGAIFLPLKEVSYIVNGTGFEIGVKRKDHANRVLLSTDLFTRIKLDDLQLVEFNLRVPKLSLFFSPADLSIYSALGKISSKESMHARDGRQLWKLAASKVGNVTSAPRLSFHKLVVIVGLWLRYVKTYEHFLSLIGYPADHFLERSCAEMSKDKMFLSSIKYHWKVISDIENELPAEAIARARRIARHRVVLNVQCVQDTNQESVVNSRFMFVCKILHLLAFLSKFICNMFHTIVKLLCLRKVLAQDPKNDGDYRTVSEDPYACSCYILNLEKIVITVCQMKAIQPFVNEKLESHIGISYSDLLSFCLSIDELLLINVQKTCEQSVFLSCGQLRMNSSSLTETSVGENSSKTYPNSVKGHKKERANDLKSILWGEPAQMFPLPETSHTSVAHDAEATCLPVLEHFLGEMWLGWRRTCVKFEEDDIKYPKNPCLLFEIKNSLIYPVVKHPNSGFWKCSLILGKLNLALGFSSILSISLLLRQIEEALSWTEDCGRARVLSDSQRSSDEQPEISTIDEQPEISSIAEQPEISSIAEQPEISSIDEQPEISSIAEQPEISSIDEQSEISNVDEQPEISSIDEQSEISSVDEQPEISEDSNYKYSGSGMKTVLLRMLPEKHIQVGIFIAGPHIRMSLRKEFGGLNENMNHTINEDDLHLAFDVHNIEVTVRPTSGSDLASLSGSNYAEKECLLLKGHHMTDIPISNNEKYVSRGCISLGSYLQVNGLNAYVEDSVDKQQSQILELKPITVEFSSFR